MAGNARFHDKLHRKNHHTNQTVGFPDSASDPIASPDQPFEGDFVVNGLLSSSQGISLLSANIDGDIYCDNIHVNNFTYTNYLSGTSTEVIISDGSLNGNGVNTLTLDFGRGIYNKVNNLTAMYINSDANIGMSTNSPSARLHVTSNSSIIPAVKVTQTGSAPAFIIEDQSNDPNPFMIDKGGNVNVGSLTSLSSNTGVLRFNVAGTGTQRMGLWSYADNTSSAGVFSFNKSFNNTFGLTGAPTTDGSNVGLIDFSYYSKDGILRRCASIQGEVEGNNAISGSSPGKLTFLTTTSGNSNASTKMIITHDGKVGIGTGDVSLSAYPQNLQVIGGTLVDALTVTGNTSINNILFATLSVTGDALISGLTIGNGNYNNNVNTAVGYQSLCSAQSENKYNVAVGTGTLRKISGGYGELSGAYNTAVGSYALGTSTIGEKNVAIGYYSQFGNISGYDNVSIGFHSLRTNESGFQNVAVGNFTLRYDKGNANTAIGHAALSNSLSSEDNVAIGKYALQLNLNGNLNVAVGRSALVSSFSSENVAIGSYAGNNIQYGYQNVLIGADTDIYGVDGYNQIVIGYNTNGISDNTTVLGNSSISATYLRGNVQGLKSSIEKNGPDTLSITELMNEYIVATGSTSYYLTLATANSLDSHSFWKIQTGSIIKFTILNLNTQPVTLVSSAGITPKIGTLIVPSSASKNFILRKTAPSLFDLYADV